MPTRGAGLFRGDPAPIIEEYPILYQKAGKYCGAKQEMRLVVRDQAHMAFVPVGDVPVDFSSQMVLFVTTGQVYAESYDIQIDRVWRQDQLVRVGVTKTYPQAGETGYPHPCSPYYLVVVPKSDMNVEGFATEITPAEAGRRGADLCRHPGRRRSRSRKIIATEGLDHAGLERQARTGHGAGAVRRRCGRHAVAGQAGGEGHCHGHGPG